MKKKNTQRSRVTGKERATQKEGEKDGERFKQTNKKYVKHTHTGRATATATATREHAARSAQFAPEREEKKA